MKKSVLLVLGLLMMSVFTSCNFYTPEETYVVESGVVSNDIVDKAVEMSENISGEAPFSDICKIRDYLYVNTATDDYEIMKDVNKDMYEAKFTRRVGPFRDKVRTFCQNPSGFVSAEVYDNDLTLVNGHSYKERESTNTNLAILVSHHFTHPFKKPIEYGRNVAKNLNSIGAGNIVVQRLGDIYRGKRTWDYELEKNTVKPTLKSAVAGDITFALGYRTMVSILEFIRAVDKVVEGFAHPDNLLYAPEIKFYSNKVVIDKNFETNIKGLYSIGDGGGMTRGLMMASCSGIQMARNL